MKSLIDPVEFAALLESGRTYKTCEVRDMIDAVPRIKVAPPAGVQCGAVMNAISEEQEAATRTEAEVTNIRVSEALQELESAYLEYDLDYVFYSRMHDFISRIGATETEAVP